MHRVQAIAKQLQASNHLQATIVVPNATKRLSQLERSVKDRVAIVTVRLVFIVVNSSNGTGVKVVMNKFRVLPVVWDVPLLICSRMK